MYERLSAPARTIHNLKEFRGHDAEFASVSPGSGKRCGRSRGEP